MNLFLRQSHCVVLTSLELKDQISVFEKTVLNPKGPGWNHFLFIRTKIKGFKVQAST